MDLDLLATVSLHGRPGHLRLVAPASLGVPEAAARAAASDGLDLDVATACGAGEVRWLWEGAVDGPGLAAMLRAAMVHEVVPCDIGGRPHRARAIACWYDAGHGTAVVELGGRPEPLA